MTIQLNPNQQAVLAHAVEHANGKITWFPDHIKGGARLKVLAGLLNRALVTPGANACPPEDIGGAQGYEEFLDAIRDPQHPEHQVMLDHCGGKFDPRVFHPMEAQERLDGISI
jgi:hypothetical protein